MSNKASVEFNDVMAAIEQEVLSAPESRITPDDVLTLAESPVSEKLFIPRIGQAMLDYDRPNPTETALQKLFVHEGARGNGYGSILFEACVERARSRGSKEFLAVAANERTAHCFKERFREEDLHFDRIYKETDELEPINISLDGVVRFLASNRAVLMPGVRADAMLSDNIPRILITAKLN